MLHLAAILHGTDKTLGSALKNGHLCGITDQWQGRNLAVPANSSFKPWINGIMPVIWDLGPISLEWRSADERFPVPWVF